MNSISLAGLLRRFRWKVVLTLGLVVVEAVIDLLFPLFIGIAINGLLANTYNGVIALGALAVAAQWLLHAQNQDAASIAAFFMDDAVQVGENREPDVGVDAIRERMVADYAANPNQTSDFGPERVEISESGDMAVEYGRYHDTNLGADGTGEDSGRYMTLYKKVDGTWRVTLDFVLSTAPEGG